MQRFHSVPVLLALPMLALGCATSRPFDRSTEPGGRPLSPTTAGSVIITGDALSADPGRTVLDAVKKAMPQLHISSWSQYSRCPNLELRGKDSVTGSSNPDVYVDGTRTVDTCPLVTIQAMDARRIEVYSLGVTSRPGYPSSGHGLILIFLQRADSATRNCPEEGRLRRKSPRGAACSPGTCLPGTCAATYCRPVNQSGVCRSVLFVKCCAATAASTFALFSTSSLSA